MGSKAGGSVGGGVPPRGRWVPAGGGGFGLFLAFLFFGAKRPISPIFFDRELTLRSGTCRPGWGCPLAAGGGGGPLRQEASSHRPFGEANLGATCFLSGRAGSKLKATHRFRPQGFYNAFLSFPFNPAHVSTGAEGILWAGGDLPQGFHLATTFSPGTKLPARLLTLSRKAFATKRWDQPYFSDPFWGMVNIAG